MEESQGKYLILQGILEERIEFSNYLRQFLKICCECILLEKVDTEVKKKFAQDLLVQLELLAEVESERKRRKE